MAFVALDPPASPSTEEETISAATVRRFHMQWRGRESAVAVFVLLVAAALRLAHLGAVQYREDDNALWNIVTGIARTGQVPVNGMPSSLGLSNGPFQALLLTPSAWVGADPALMTAGVGMLNVLAVALAYGFARDFFGRRVALAAMVLAAVNPWAVVLSRRLWGDDMVAPFAVLALWLLCRWLFRDRRRLLPVAAAALAVVSQVYIVGLECLVTAGFALALSGRRLWTRWTVVAAVVFAVLIGPYVAGAALEHWQALGHIAGSGGPPPRLDLTAARYALDLASEEGYQAFAMQGGPHLDATSGFPAVVGMLARLLYLLGIAGGLATLLRGPGRLTAAPRGVHLLLLTWIVVPILPLLRHAVPVYPYYLVTTFPAPYVYGALGLVRLWRWAACLGRVAGAAAKALVAAAAASLVTVPVALAAVFFSVIGQYWPAAVYGMPWAMSNQLVHETLLLQRQDHAARVLVPAHNQELNVLERLLVQGGAPAEEFDDQRLLVLPAARTLYLAVGEAPAQRALEATYSRFLIRQQRLPGQGVAARWYLIPAGSGGAVSAPPSVAPQWVFADAGRALFRLDSVQLPARVHAGETVKGVAVLTALERPAADVPDFSVYLHLVNSAGQTVAGQDAATLSSRRWLPGDRVVQWFSLTLPATLPVGVLHSVIGMYSVGLPSHPVIHPLQVSDAAGHTLGASATGPSVAIPPAPAAVAPNPLQVDFADHITLAGYDLRQRGSTLAVTLYWQADAAVPAAYTAFVHVVSVAGALVAQHDGPPMDGRFPTTFWRPGDRIADVHVIALPAGLTPGRYRLAFGLYDSRTQQPLAVVSGRPEVTVTLAGN